MRPSNDAGCLVGSTSTRLLATVLLVLVLAAGGLAETGLAGDSSRFEARNEAGYRGVLQFSSTPLVTMRPTPFRLELFAPDGGRITGGQPEADLTMPAMPMPENRPAVTSDGGGYRGEAVFTMAGAWQVTVTVDPDGDRTTRLVFDIPRVLLK